MSLQIWLPLNKNLQNKGLIPVSVTNNGATIDNNGKIGKCYKFGTTAGSLAIPVNVMKNFSSACSIAF